MIKAIFYTRFHPGKGLVHQVPEGSIIPSSVPPHPSLIVHPPLFDFSLISEYIIPRQEFCDCLVTICVNHNRVIGYPVCITDELKYDRNEFIFNFAVVMDEKEDSAAWEMVVRRLARLMRSLEEQGGFLSKEEAEDEDGPRISGPDSGHELGHKTATRRVYALCEMIMEDLNNYSECMIPIDQSNTLNLKLFPPRAPPPHVHGWHVPLAIVRLSALQTSTWDLTISQIIPHINGTNSVHLISQLADTDFTLTRKAIQHLLYYHCILLLDIFQFSAIYAPTPEISLFLTDETMQEECRRYVTLPDSSRSDVGMRPQRSHSPEHCLLSSPTTPSPPSSTKPKSIPQTARPSTPDISNAVSISGSTAGGGGGAGAPSLDSLLTLYTSLKQGLTVKAWCIENAQLLGRVDIRRFITFGVIKGFLYRVHKYAVTGQVPTPPKGVGAGRSQAEGEKGRDGVGAVGRRERGGEREKEKEQDAFRKAATSSGWATPGEGQSGIAAGLKSLSLRQSGDGSVAKGDAGSMVDRGGDRQENADSAEVRSGGSPKKNEREFLPLARYLDGLHCFDEICSDLKMSEREVLGKLRGYGEVCVIHR
ncbi:NPR2-domain-containing protein [Viridothelium virens]|uniref:NPR2-domain-containing protein n=1 Tax=Viridothelium virens TaxID=1048519 RepID=A0A6A6GY60_VIRVR|nr:NPR2-domain-containing protein [Viridothelium virens]